MPVHIFAIQSVGESLVGGDSIERTYFLLRTYLKDLGQLGDFHDGHLKCHDKSSVVKAIIEFTEWARSRPEDDPKLLWFSLHGKPPENKLHVGIHGLSAEFTQSREPGEIVDWHIVLNSLHGKCAPNVVVMMDVCWGGSPAAPAGLTARNGTPKFLFGPIRAGHRIELDTATGLIISTLLDGFVPSLERAEAVVTFLNQSFPKDLDTGNEFYRVWSWNEAGTPHCYPAPSGRIRRAT
jgi:hypothetical protein